MQKQISILPLKLRDEQKFAPKTRGTRFLYVFHVFLHSHVAVCVLLCVCMHLCVCVLFLTFTSVAGAVAVPNSRGSSQRPEVCHEIALMPHVWGAGSW